MDLRVSHTLKVKMGGSTSLGHTRWNGGRWTTKGRPRRISFRKGRGLVPKKPTNLCGWESDDHEDGVGPGTNSTLLSDTLWSIGLTESDVRETVWLWKRPMDLCRYESEEYDDGMGPGVNTNLFSDTFFWNGNKSRNKLHQLVNRSRRMCQKDKGLVVKKNPGPVSMKEWVTWSWGGCYRECYNNVRCTLDRLLIMNR